MLSGRSILSRILWLHLIAIVATAILVPLAVNFLLTQNATSLQHRELELHANAIASALTQNTQGDWALDLDPDLRTLYANEFGGFSFAVVDPKGGLLFGDPPAPAHQLRTAARGEGPKFFELRREKRILVGGSFPRHLRGKTAWVLVAQDLQHPDMIVDDIVAGFLKRAALITIPILLILFSLDILIIRRALQPVVAASAVARRIDTGSMDQRLPTSSLPREIRPMAEAINEALDRLAAGYRVQREFTADAAHELRTPLAIMRMQIDAFPKGEQASALLARVDHMTRIVTQLLEIAELETTTSRPGIKADLHALSLEVAADMTPLALAEGKKIALTGDAGPVWVAGSRPLLYRAIRNLVENAIEHTPSGTSIEIRVAREGFVSVIDNGPGIPAEERGQVFQRFWRGERNREGGAGLGLAIAESAARNCGGTVVLEDVPGRGATFTLRLQLAPRDKTQDEEKNRPAIKTFD